MAQSLLSLKGSVMEIHEGNELHHSTQSHCWLDAQPRAACAA